MDSSLEFQIKVSYFEIYLDKIRDLLDGKMKLNPITRSSNYFDSNFTILQSVQNKFVST